jgi:uncharacterized cupin superfamily protein
MGVPTSEVGYTSATAGRGDREVHKGHVVVLGKKIKGNFEIGDPTRKKSKHYMIDI